MADRPWARDFILQPSSDLVDASHGNGHMKCMHRQVCGFLLWKGPPARNTPDSNEIGTHNK